MSNLNKVQEELNASRVLQEKWMSNGWDFLEIEETNLKILEMYPLVEVPFPEPVIRLYIELENFAYQVPLKDVSSINPNFCLTVTKQDLYFDWKQRIESNLEKVPISEFKTIVDRGVTWDEMRYVSEDGTLRIVWQRYD